MHLSVITATWQRPSRLAGCLRQFRQQSPGGLECEHIVVSDGPDPRAEQLARFHAARYLERTQNGGKYGVAAKDDGVRIATGDYVCFWDDDNQCEPHALATLYTAAAGVDIGVVQVRHLVRKTGRIETIPRTWSGQFQLGDVDTLCVCVRRELALREPWEGPEDRNTDFHWLDRLSRHAPVIRFVPVIVGDHL